MSEALKRIRHHLRAAKTHVFRMQDHARILDEEGAFGDEKQGELEDELYKARLALEAADRIVGHPEHRPVQLTDAELGRPVRK